MKVRMEVQGMEMPRDKARFLVQLSQLARLGGGVVGGERVLEGWGWLGGGVVADWGIDVGLGFKVGLA